MPNTSKEQLKMKTVIVLLEVTEGIKNDKIHIPDKIKGS
jgi:hypothetical protein